MAVGRFRSNRVKCEIQPAPRPDKKPVRLMALAARDYRGIVYVTICTVISSFGGFNADNTFDLGLAVFLLRQRRKRTDPYPLPERRHGVQVLA